MTFEDAVRAAIAACLAPVAVAVAVTTQINGSAPMFPDNLGLPGLVSAGTYGRGADEIVFLHSPTPGSNAGIRIMVTRRVAGGWSAPMAAVPESGHFVGSPAVGADGTLYFETTRREPMVPTREDSDLWAATRNGDGWLPPRLLGAPFDSPFNEHNVSISNLGTACVNSARDHGHGRNDIYCSVRTKGIWQPLENLGPLVNSPSTEMSPHIEREDRYVLFASDRPGGAGAFDIYMSVKQGATWSAPVGLGPSINSDASELHPSVSPDGRRLLFTRTRGRGADTTATMHEVPFADLVKGIAPGFTEAPAARGGHAMAYDEDRGVTLLFGGSGRQGHLNDLWEWDGRQWRFVTASGPTPRNAVVFVYDSRRKRAVLVGGRTAQGLKVDTWEWDGTQWHEREVSGPDIRLHHHGAYDARRGRLVLHGGLRPVGRTIEPLSDTWEWDGAQWTRLDERGLSAFPNAMAYDVHRGAVVISAVEGTMPPDAARPSALWTWDGTGWTRITERFGAPEMAPGQPMTSDALGLVLLDGAITQGQQAFTWQWKAAAWSRSPAAPPVPQRVSHAMAYDTRRKRVVMFGGHAGSLPGRSGEIYGDTWEWDGASWTRMPPH